MTSTDVLDYTRLENLGINIWIDGGWSVDALLGEQTRHHDDLDIVIQQKDVLKLRELLEAKGYKDVKLEIARSYNFVLGDEKDHEIDVHVIVLDDEGNGIYGPVENGEMYPFTALSGVGAIEGRTVKCTSPEWMVQSHIGYKLRDSDYKDIIALCEKFGIDYPEEFAHLKKSN